MSYCSAVSMRRWRHCSRDNAQYDEARRLSDGSDSCWSHPDNDSDNETRLEVDIESLPMGEAGEGVSQRG